MTRGDDPSRRAASPWIVTLDDPAAADIQLTGGKASSLAELFGIGAPIPAGFVVTTAAYRRGRHAGRISKRLRADLAAAYVVLGARAVAARSSATTEDLAGASFAGQYATVLNVRDEAALAVAVEAVWASTGAESAIAYRRRLGIREADVAMAVLVQAMVEPVAAGVLFTRDPVSGAGERFVASAVLGAGEGLVAGSIPADRFVLDAATGRVVERTVVDKERRLAPDPGGGLREVPVPASRRGRPALTTTQLRSLWQLGRAIRDRRGADQDIEFAIVGGVVHLLQARPMTGSPLQATDRGDARPYRRSPTAKPMRRLHEDYWRAILAVQAETFVRVPIPPLAEHELVVADGFRYVRAASEPADAEAALRAVLETSAAFWARGTTMLEAEILPRLRAAYAADPPIHSDRAPLARHVAHLERALALFATAMGELHWSDAPTIDDPGTEFEQITGLPAGRAEAFILGIRNELTRMIGELMRLAGVVATSPLLAAIFDARAYERLDSPDVRADPAGARFRRRFRRFLARYGRRSGVGVGARGAFEDPTWGMNPREPLDLIRLYARADAAEGRRRDRRLAARRRAAVRSMRRRLADDPERLARFERWLWAAQLEARLLEDHNVLMDQEVGGRLREAIWWVGRALVRRGLIDEPNDVLHLSVAELRAIADARRPADRRALVAERKAEHERRRSMDPPLAVDARGQPVAAADAEAEAPTVPAPGSGSDSTGSDEDAWIVRGVPVSAGVVTGRAVVTTGAGLPAHVEPGDILVAPNAGPDLTPLLPLLGGLVLDLGSPFQHSALVAREYSLPAVFGTRDGTDRIVDGERITVDGRAGTVRRERGA